VESEGIFGAQSLIWVDEVDYVSTDHNSCNLDGDCLFGISL
jgi:hypothetical protein